MRAHRLVNAGGTRLDASAAKAGVRVQTEQEAMDQVKVRRGDRWLG